MTLSVCMICKNEEKNIGRAITSILSIADEIIVVDTGSTDHTLGVLKDYPIKLFHHTWHDDFAEARNTALSHATGDWILSLDADEFLDSPSAETLITLLEAHPDSQGFFCTLVNTIDGKPSTSAIVFRLFRRNPSYHFKGKVHEQILDSIFAHYPEDHLLGSSLQIYHDGYDPAVSDNSAKNQRNLDLLLGFEEKDKDNYYYYCLANELIRAEHYDSAIACYKQSIACSSFPAHRPFHLPYLLLNLMRLLLMANTPDEALSYFNQYVPYYQDFKDLYFLGAVAALSVQNYTLAHQSLSTYHTLSHDNILYPTTQLGEIFNIPAITEAISRGVFMEENPISPRRLPLIIGILDTASPAQLTQCLTSIQKLNCPKILLTTTKLPDTTQLTTTYGVTIIETPIGQNNLTLRNTLLHRLMYHLEHPDHWLLLLDSNEGMSYIGLLQLQSLLQSPPPYQAFALEISEGEIIHHDIRLLRAAPSLSYTDYSAPSLLSSCLQLFGEDYLSSVPIRLIRTTMNPHTKTTH